MPTPRPTLRQQLLDALVPWFMSGERRPDALEIEDLLREPEIAPLATQLGYVPEMTLLQRDRLEADVHRAVRRARTAEALRLGQTPGVPARTDRALSLALADVAAAAREAVRRVAAAEGEAERAGDAPAAFELAQLGEDARVLASACEFLSESRALRSA